jgi:hypothetical protein
MNNLLSIFQKRKYISALDKLNVVGPQAWQDDAYSDEATDDGIPHLYRI